MNRMKGNPSDFADVSNDFRKIGLELATTHRLEGVIMMAAGAIAMSILAVASSIERSYIESK